MDAFLTILIWLGSGFALAVGVFIGATLMCWVANARSKTDETAAESVTLLRERNEIGTRQAELLVRIACCLEERLPNQ